MLLIISLYMSCTGCCHSYITPPPLGIVCMPFGNQNREPTTSISLYIIIIHPSCIGDYKGVWIMRTANLSGCSMACMQRESSMRKGMYIGWGTRLVLIHQHVYTCICRCVMYAACRCYFATFLTSLRARWTSMKFPLPRLPKGLWILTSTVLRLNSMTGAARAVNTANPQKANKWQHHLHVPRCTNPS